MKILHYTLKKKWFDMEMSGEKSEEYREITPYWQRRLTHFGEYIAEVNGIYMGTEPRVFDAVKARNGYGKNVPTFIRECLGINVGIGNPEWGAPDYPVFIIKLGKLVNNDNNE